MKITQDNFYEMYPQSNMTFKTIADGRFSPGRTMKAPNSFQQIRYLEPDDIIIIANKRIEIDSGPNKVANKKKWEAIIKQSEKLLEGQA